MTRARRNMYAPALGIVGFILILIVVLAFGTYRNINEHKQQMERHLLREGTALIRAFEAGTRSGMMGMGWGRNRLQTLVEEMAKEPDIAYIILMDEKGTIVARNQGEHMNLSIAREIDLERLRKESRLITSIRELKPDERVFEIIKPFRPLERGFRGHMMRGMHGFGRGRPPFEGNRELLEENLTIFLGLNMRDFEIARARDINHTIMMTVVLFIVGSAAFYFMFVIYNYYLTNQTLENMKSYTKSVVDNMANGLISIDNKSRIVTNNLLASQILGSREKRLRGKHISDIFKTDDLNIEDTIFSGKGFLEKEINYKKDDKEIIPISISASQLKDEEGSSMGAVLILRDLREVKELQEKVRRAERMASLGRLAAGVAHEIRNPLGSIRGFAQYFKNRFDQNTEDQKYASIMIKEVDRLNRVISELLDFARPAEPDFKEEDIKEILEHSLKLVESDTKNVNISLDVEEGLEKIKADRDQLTQAFLNIFLNSVDAMENHGKISISARKMKERDQIEIRISDNGRGIAKENLSKLFDPFFTTRKDGTGLGLAIVHKIVENHKGEIEVKSEEDKGTTFSIFLPLKS